MKITIGLTRSNRTRGADDYVPSADGYRAGAGQDEIQVDVPNLTGLTREQVADAAFTVTNTPSPDLLSDTPGAHQVLTALQAVSTGGRLRSLSIGDTVTVDGRKLACVAAGWVDVTDDRDAPAYDDTPVAEDELDPEIRALLKEV